MNEHAQLLEYYKNKFKNHFSPAVLDYKINKIYNEALQTYDPNKTQFQTHLATHMQKMNREALSKGSLLKETEYMRNIHSKILKEYDKQLLQGINPDPKKIAKKVGVKEDLVHDALNKNYSVSIAEMPTYKMEVDFNSLLPDMTDKEKRIAETIEQDMPLNKALNHTGLKKTTYYDERKKLLDRFKKAYYNLSKETYDY